MVVFNSVRSTVPYCTAWLSLAAQGLALLLFDVVPIACWQQW
jgi:hypothetical protein